MEKINNIDNKDPALEPVEPIIKPGKVYGSLARKWQGIPSIERTKKGRLWVTFYSGGEGEGPQNYVVLKYSDDEGETWSEPVLVIDPPGNVRAFDPCIWHDPSGRLWLFWAQSNGLYDGRIGVWSMICNDPDAENVQWSKPRRIANGIMMNKPLVLSTGEWLMPCALWDYENEKLSFLKKNGYIQHDIKEEKFSNVYCSSDQGENFYLLGKADVPDRSFDEHHIIERIDGSLWMLVRTFYGIGESISFDKGKTWNKGKPTNIGGPSSRFFIRRLYSGNLLLVNHYNFTGRNNLTAMISKDDGKTWEGFLLLDERDNVSYPDGVQAEDGRIFVVYDRERYGAKEILMAVFTEEDVISGKCVTEKARLKVLVDKAGS